MKLKKHWRIAAVTVALGLTISTLTGCVGQPSTPQDTVKAYLEAVQSGDAARAVQLIDPGVAKSKRTLLTGAVLKKSGKIDHIVVLIPVANGAPVDSSGQMDSNSGANHLEINATYDIDGKTAKAQFIADKTPDGWRVTGGYEHLSVPITKMTPTYSVNSKVIEESSTEDGQIIVFPGDYQIDLVDNKLITMTGGHHSTADRDQNPTFDVSASVRNDFDSQLKTFLTTCFAVSADSRDHACPNWKYTGEAVVSDVKWQLVAAPKYVISFDIATGKVLIKNTQSIAQHLSYTYQYIGFLTTASSLESSDTAGDDVLYTPVFSDGKLTFTPANAMRENVIRSYGEKAESSLH